MGQELKWKPFFRQIPIVKISCFEEKPTIETTRNEGDLSLPPPFLGKIVADLILTFFTFYYFLFILFLAVKEILKSVDEQ